MTRPKQCRVATVMAAMGMMIAIMSGCTRNKPNALVCTKEQQAKLMGDTATELTADTTTMTEIDARSIADQRFDFADIVRDLHFIPLETTPESRLDKIRRLSFTEGNIIASDSKGVKVFGAEGRFVGAIPFGRGSERNDYTIDRGRNEILVFTQGSIGHYDMKCQRLWVESIPLTFSAMGTTRSGNALVMYAGRGDRNGNIGDIDDASFIVMNRQGAITHFFGQRDTEGLPPREGTPLQLSSDGLMMCRNNCDTISTLTDNGLTTLYTLKYRESTGTENYFFAGNALMTDTTLFFKLQNIRAKTAYAFYDRKKGRLVGGVPTFDYRIMPPIYNPTVVYGDYFVATFNTYLTEDGKDFRFVGDCASESEKEKIKGVKHDANPILALYRIEL